MKLVVALTILCLLAGCISPPLGVKKSDHLFSIGTYQKGNNITEPQPQESEYLRTSTGGFEIIQGLAAFKLYIDIIKSPARRVYTRAIVPNPQDLSEPFVYDHYLDPSTPSTTITHGPVLGLKMYKDYIIEFILFADESRTQEIDRLTQKIRCYLDTTGPQLKLYRRMKTKTS
jgi:hypothetical protein